MPQEPLNQVQLNFIKSEMEDHKPLPQILQEQGYDIRVGQASRQLREAFGIEELQRLRKGIRGGTKAFEFQIGRICKRFLETPEITPEMLDRAALVLQECASDLEAHKGKLS